MKVKITSDSTCDLPIELIRKYDIAITSLTVTLGEASFQDGLDMDPEAIYPYVEQTGTLPKTSAVSIGGYCEVFRRWVEKGYEVVHFSLSSELSSTYQNACIAAEEVGHVSVVDSRNLSSGQGLIVLRAAELAGEGADAQTILQVCEQMIPNVETSFVIDTLDYLYKGGRCSALSAFGANLLKIKPCILVQDGKMLPGKKYRGTADKVICSYAEDRLKDRTDIDASRVFLTHTRCSEGCVKRVEGLIREYLPDVKELIISTAGSTITTHCGPNCLGVLFVRKEGGTEPET